MASSKKVTAEAGAGKKSSESESEEEFQVEAIRGWRYHLRKDQMQYFIKWLNYPEDDNTWEPEEYMNCPKILEDYKNSLTGKERKYFFYKEKDRLSGFQRNATFLDCVGADTQHTAQTGQQKEDKYKFYCLVTFRDSEYAEEVTLEEFYMYEPKRAMEFIEQRLLASKKK